MSVNLKGRDLISIKELTPEEFFQFIETAVSLKTGLNMGQRPDILKNRTLAEIFQKPSLRTRVSFESSMTHLGGHGIYLGPDDIKLGQRETTEDIAKVLSGMADVIMARVFENKTVRDLAEYASIPVINGLCDYEHPTQALGDFLTIYEKYRRFDGLKICYIGDGNNVCNSTIFSSALMGTHITAVTAPGFEPTEEVISSAKAIAERYNTGSIIEVTNSIEEGIKDSDIVYTDVWASMGQEAQADEKKKTFMPYQVTLDVFNKAKPTAIFMHCLPAHYGEECTHEVAHCPRSVIFDQAANRMHSIKSILALVTP
ncbi:MAG TPA: ornithine carbamoyltransferase [Thermotogota bacterium]|nr:ornithine carbamoyltransferase [Thermotogota bacterium]HPJ88022.1 ornithine carbamoyltransferase [Thermotogota bacterium]HPR95109.1 ornithine carbamoyltransferase [Thermotogota bacterium]